MFRDVLNLFQDYMGTGLIVVWFLASLIYLWIVEKRKNIRILYVYVPIILLILFFNPLFITIVYKIVGDEIYYRIMWLLPMTITIAYAAVRVMGALRGWKQVAFGIVTIVLIAVSGSYIYDNPHFSRAENKYHVPQVVADICDAIEVEGREVRGIFPAEMLQYVRQYSPVVCMPYGREMLVPAWAAVNPLYNVMEAEEIDAKALVEGCREQWVFYIILHEDRRVVGDFVDYGFEYFATIEDYVIYKDATIDLSIE